MNYKYPNSIFTPTGWPVHRSLGEGGRG